MRLLLNHGPVGRLILVVWLAAIAQFSTIAGFAAAHLSGVTAWGITATLVCALTGGVLPAFITQHRK